MLREMSSKYGRTPGGYVWALVQPIGALVVITAVFSVILRTPSLGNSFALFYASGYMVFLLYSELLIAVQNSIRYSRPLLLYPAVSWIDAIIARVLLNVLTGLLVLIIVFSGILVLLSINTIFDFGPILLSIALACLLGAGLGIFNCVVGGLYPAYGRVWDIAMRPVFLASGIFFLYEDLPPRVQDILWFSPWIHFTALFREGVYPSYEPDFVSIPLLLAWSLIPMCLGLLLMRRHYQTLLNR